MGSTKPDTRTWTNEEYAAYQRGRRGEPEYVPQAPKNYADLKHSFDAWEVHFGERGGQMAGRCYALFHKDRSQDERHIRVAEQLRSGGTVDQLTTLDIQWTRMEWGRCPSDLAQACLAMIQGDGSDGLVPGDFADPNTGVAL